MDFNSDDGIFSNSDIHNAGFQDDNGIYHWRDGHSLNDGNIPLLDLHDGMTMNGIDSNDSMTDHNGYIPNHENNSSDMENSHSNNVNIDQTSDSKETLDDNSHLENKDHTNDVSFGSGYYFYSPNGERLYQCSDGHVYDYNNNKVK